MPTSEARINANRLNASHSTGPKTDEGKERSRANSLKHGMTGVGVVLAEADAIEVERRSVAFVEELSATGEVEISLARRAALNAVRMERGADQQTASLTIRGRQVEADFVAPEGVSAEEADRLRSEAVRASMFDPSKEATRARAYETAAERSFFRALKELRQIQKQAKREVRAQAQAAKAVDPEALLGSFLQMQKTAMTRNAEIDSFLDEMEESLDEFDVEVAARRSKSPQFAPSMSGNDLAFSVGRPR